MVVGRHPAGAFPRRHPTDDLIGGRVTDYTATAICEGDHWAIDGPGGTAEADSVDDLQEMADPLLTVQLRPASSGRILLSLG